MTIDTRSWAALSGRVELGRIDPAAAIWFEDAVRAIETSHIDRAQTLWAQVSEASKQAIYARLEDLRTVLPRLTT